MEYMKRTIVAALLVSFGCAEGPEAGPIYQLLPVTRRDIVISASASGSVEPIKTVEVKSKASGEILEVRVETGDQVTRGQLLVRVDPRVPENSLMQAEADLEVSQAQLANAQSELRRAEALFETQSITEQEYEAARLSDANANASLVRAQRQLEDARIAFEDTEVRSPQTGIILERNVEVGTVIQSATNNVSGGVVLLKMADLDTVRVRTLVDETDIGKIQPGMPVSIRVDAYPNQPFEGVVLKIEPQALETQNVTMFPVLVHIANEAGLLKPGMNSEVEISIGSRLGVLAVPNNALRTERDVQSAAAVLGLDAETLAAQLSDGARTMGGSVTHEDEEGNGDSGHVVMFRGQEVTLPPDLTLEQVNPLLEKIEADPQAFRSFSEDERAIIGRVREAAGGGRFGGQQGGGPGGGRPGPPEASVPVYSATGEHIVFVLRDSIPTAIRIRTGLTDLDYTEVLSGLTEADSVMILPSASMVQAQAGQGPPGSSTGPGGGRGKGR
jgi:HlyD family secretion protein